MEKVLHSAWRRAGLRGASVRGRDGKLYRVIYPGRPGGSSGPDFRDAIIESEDGSRIYGDIEAHVRSNEWSAHGHGGDSRYNGVVFHVVLEDTAAHVRTRSSLSIPLLVLDQRHSSAPPLIDETLDESGEAEPGSLPIPFLNLTDAGMERLKNRSHGLQIAMAAAGRDQAIWEAAVETLGYPSNKKGFRQLARRLNWPVVSALAGRLTVSELEQIAMGAAGFGPKPGFAPRLTGVTPQWNRSHGRPANHPRNRVPALAAWAMSWRDRGPAGAISELVRSAGSAGELSDGLTGSGDKVPGVSRRRDTVVNVILPGAHALAEMDGDRRTARKAIDLYRSHPKTQRNSIEAEAALLLRVRGIDIAARGACEQQGLIHIYRLMTSPARQARQLPLM